MLCGYGCLLLACCSAHGGLDKKLTSCKLHSQANRSLKTFIQRQISSRQILQRQNISSKQSPRVALFYITIQKKHKINGCANTRIWSWRNLNCFIFLELIIDFRVHGIITIQRHSVTLYLSKPLQNCLCCGKFLWCESNHLGNNDWLILLMNNAIM